MLTAKQVLLLASLNIRIIQIHSNWIHFNVEGEAYENSTCIINATKTGTCQYVKNCPTAIKDLQNSRHLVVCGFEENDVMVCCELNESKIETLGMSSIMCKKNEVEICDVYLQTQEIISGGIEVEAKEFRYMAAIGYGNKTEVQWHCGGSLISNRYVLSAAHCTSPSWDLGDARWVRLGDVNLKSNDDDASPQDFEIIQHINHPDYIPSQVYNDIALYKLDTVVAFNEYIMPVCLQTSYDIPSDKGTATGWGRMGYAHPVSDTLLKVNLTLVSANICSALKGTSVQLPNGIDSRTMICAGEEDGVKDTCQGDSGGPLSIEGAKCLPTQVGITSVGSLCSLPNSPGIYTRISHFVPWIESVVWRSE